MAHGMELATKGWGNFQCKSWGSFRYDKDVLATFEGQFLKNAGEALGAFKHIPDDEKDILKIELISEEALKTSKIEGELLDRDSLQSSICRQGFENSSCEMTGDHYRGD